MISGAETEAELERAASFVTAVQAMLSDCDHGLRGLIIAELMARHIVSVLPRRANSKLTNALRERLLKQQLDVMHKMIAILDGARSTH